MGLWSRIILALGLWERQDDDALPAWVSKAIADFKRRHFQEYGVWPSFYHKHFQNKDFIYEVYCEPLTDWIYQTKYYRKAR